MQFFQEGHITNLAYVNIRDESHLAQSKAYVEELWSSFCPLADANFLSDAREHFLERFWEMYLARALQIAGHQPKTTKGGGPDFVICAEGNRIWIEATALGPGQGVDAVPGIQYGAVQEVPEEQILLRIRNAISEKLMKWRRWSEKGIVAPKDGFIIAINACQIRSVLSDTLPPYIVKAALPFGSEVFVMDMKTTEAVDSYYDFRNRIAKKSGQDVHTDIFMDDSHREVSALIYSLSDMINKPAVEGEDFVVVRNPNAACPISQGLFRRGQEYWVENGSLRRKSW